MADQKMAGQDGKDLFVQAVGPGGPGFVQATAPLDFSGTWIEDRSRSTSAEAHLKAIGVSWLVRKAACSGAVNPILTIVQGRAPPDSQMAFFFRGACPPAAPWVCPVPHDRRHAHRHPPPAPRPSALGVTIGIAFYLDGVYRGPNNVRFPQQCPHQRAKTVEG